MPAGVSWGQYLKFGGAAMVAMMAGAQTVHIFYKPLKDLDSLVEKEKELMKQQAEQLKGDTEVQKYS